jgi:hypothetical protein
MDGFKIADEVFQERRCVGCMPDLSGHHKRHSAALFEESGGRHEEGRP